MHTGVRYAVPKYIEILLPEPDPGLNSPEDDAFLLYRVKLVEKLDVFALEAAKSKKEFHCRQNRKSSQPPPPDAPNWSLKPEWNVV